MMCNRRVYRVFRGGSGGDDPRNARVACHCGIAPGYRGGGLGVRLVKGELP